MSDWPQTLRHAELVAEKPPRRGNESNADYTKRSLVWRAWAAAARPDQWHASEQEVREWTTWMFSIGRRK